MSFLADPFDGRVPRDQYTMCLDCHREYEVDEWIIWKVICVIEKEHERNKTATLPDM